jgi:putative transcriptional regulator
MDIGAGKILISSSSMDDPTFRSSVLFITEHNDKGAMAFVINQVFERPLNQLTEFISSPPFPLYSGGPVDKEHLFFIHRCPDLVPAGAHIIDDIYLGGDFKKAIAYINQGILNGSMMKIFIGYSGWDAGELEAEIEEGSWEIAHADAAMVFNTDAMI